MSKVGSLEIRTNSASGRIEGAGTIRTIDAKLGFRLTPTEQRSEKAPTHLLEVRTSDGEFIEVGAAWQREMKRGDHIGEHMFSLTFSDPSLPDWMSNLAAFPGDERSDAGNALYRIEFERKRRDSENNQRAE